jgi:tetratricopeptide (TPR) repeat protein
LRRHCSPWALQKALPETSLRPSVLEREAVSIFAATGNEPQLRQALGLLAWVQIAQRNYSEARALCERALDLARDAGDDRGVVLALGNLGHVLMKQGKTEEAFARLCDVLAVAYRLTDLKRDRRHVSSTSQPSRLRATRTSGQRCCWRHRASCASETEEALDRCRA